MNLIILILDLYIVAHAVWLYLLQTNRDERHALTPYLSRICDPFCRLFQDVDLKIHERNMALAVPLLTLVLVRFVLSAFY